MSKISKKIFFIILAYFLANVISSTQAQEIPQNPANVISNYYSSNYSTPIPILDNTTNTITIQVTNAIGKIWDVNLQTDIKHTFTDDLNIFLTSPFGTRISLTTDNGGDTTNTLSGTYWDDQAATNVSDATFTDNVVQSRLQPEGAMSAFDGENPNGNWTLTVIDDANADIGSLDAAQLNIATYVGKLTYVTRSYINSVSTPIPDNASISPTVTVTGLPYRIHEVKVYTKIPHTDSGNLDITLTSPAGTTIVLVTDRAGGITNVFNGTLWYDKASETIGNLATGFVDNVVKTDLVPDGTLGAFKGENPNGIWTLNVADDTLLNTGNLDTWSLEITTASAGVNDVNGDGYTDLIGIKRKEVRVLSQQAGQTTSNVVSYGEVPRGYKVVGGYDVNTNGLSDLIVQRKDEIGYLNITNGAISSTPTPISTAPKRYKVAASGDINSDDYTDIIVTRGRTIGALIGPSYNFQEILEKNKNGKVVGVVQTNIICQKGKKVYRVPITAGSGTNTSPTAGAAVTLTEEATGKVVGVSEVNTNDGYEIIAQKKKDISYGAWDSSNYSTDLWTDKGKEKENQVGPVVAPQ